MFNSRGEPYQPLRWLERFLLSLSPWLTAGSPASGGVSEASRFASLSRANRDGSLTFGGAACPGLSLSSRQSGLTGTRKETYDPGFADKFGHPNHPRVT